MAVASEPTESRSVDLPTHNINDNKASSNLSGSQAGNLSKSITNADEDKNRAKGKKTNKCNNKTNSNKDNKSKKTKKKLIESEQSEATCQSINADGSILEQAKPKPLHVEELKLFQNNNLLNQQDPIQQLQAQLNELIRNDDTNRPSPNPNEQSQAANRLSANGQPLILTANYANEFGLQENSTNIGTFESESDNIFTVKKGVLWQQQNYDKFHQRLFSRWKKRFFILTTGYLVCFQRSTCRVGRSEMGKFLYKTSLSDVTNIEWLKPKKSDKGAIVLHLIGPFNLLLWSKQNLDEWMFMIKESIERNKIRRACLMQNATTNNNLPDSKNGSEPQMVQNDGDLYENTKQIDEQQRHAKQTNENQSPIKLLESANKQLNGNKSVSDSAKNENDSQQENHNLKKKNSSSPSSTKVEAKLRSQQESVVKQMVEHEEDKVVSARLQAHNNDQRGKIDQGNSTPRKSSSSSSSSSSPASSQATLESDQPNLIERESSGGNTVDDLANGKRVDIVRSSEKGRKATATMINDDSSSKEGSRERAGRLNHSSPSSLSSSSALASKRSGKVARSVQSDKARDNISSSSAAAPANVDKSAGSPRETAPVKGGSDCSASRLSRGSRSDRATGIEGDKSSFDNNNNSCNLANSEPMGQENAAAAAAADGHDDDNQQQSRRLPKEKVSSIQARPVGNLIRGESLVSLARIGKVAPTAVQVAQRSLYAQHIMPNNQDEMAAYNNNIRRQQMINIESSVTPIRRHQSIKAKNSSYGRSRAAPQTSSLDLPNPPTPMMANQHITSYQQKLLQLQLLHNSNNVDYIRNNGSDLNDYQVYGSNHYGYSSMRSNLKSAASEFSFIRPYSANRNQQSTLPHQNHHHNQQQQLLNRQQNQLLDSTRQQPICSSFNAASDQQGSNVVPVLIDNNNNNNNNCQQLTPLTKQFLVNPVTGERIINLPGPNDLGSIAPMRELPLKPNKKRQANNSSANGHLDQNSSNLPKSSSLTSSIACFFRRAFSRRSKKGSRKRSRLAESCSSSLGAFEEGATVVPVVPSAFSTGSKSIDGHHNKQNKDFNNNNQQPVQSQRMVDMIEAFTNRALLNPTEHQTMAPDACLNNPTQSDNIRSQQQQQQQYSAFNMEFNAPPRLPAAPPTPATPKHLRRSINNFGSPMHKSNSICATMGLSLVNSNNQRRTFLQDNEMLMGNALACENSRSPMLMRSTKVMSAHLTPLMLQRDPIDPSSTAAAAAASNHQFILSPRNSKLDQMPRPSSIYGQPSMISSPIMNNRDERNNNFGAHRNSLHNHQFSRDNIPTNAASFELRRYNQMMKAPFLDTTREVAEELASPNSETIPNEFMERADNQSPQCNARYFIKRDYTFDVINGSQSNSSIQQQQQQQQHHHQQRANVVNPIIQSPTTDNIYDNHPMLNATELSSYSHYDNNVSANHQLQSPSIAQRSSSNNMISSKTQYIIRQQAQADYQPKSLDDHYSNRGLINVKPQFYTPSRQSRLLNDERALTVADMMVSNKKPSAIVAPSTPTSGKTPLVGIRNDSNLISDQQQQQQQQQQINRLPQSPLIHQSQSRSPMMSRRAYQNHQSHYQQSPLVSQQTRILSKGDGIQATIIGNGMTNRHLGQPVVSIAGAPGINLEPSLAASLLRGTNIDAYESSTFTNEGSAFDDPQLSSKTFLVSTRLSKSIASSQSSSNYNGSPPSSMFKNEQCVTSTIDADGINTTKPAKDDELSAASSSSRSASSSIGGRSLRIRKTNRSGDNQEDQLSSSGTDTPGSKGLKNNKVRYNSHTKSSGPRSYNRTISMRSEKESSSEPSDGTGSSQRSSLTKEVDERNWITSKLVE